MLTTDLVRVTRRKGAVYPRYIDASDAGLRDVAEQLVAVFDRAIESEPRPKRAELDESIADIVEHKADPVLFRGFVKLLLDRCSFDQETERDPTELRARLFEEAARDPMRRAPGRPWSEKRAELVARIAAELELTPERLDELLFADLAENQRLVSYKPLTAEALLDRYNLSLAQAVLLRAVRLVVDLAPAEVGSYRQLFRELKFRQLIHTVTTRGDGGYRVEIDGPVSLFSSANRYGLAMALFLPTLVMLETWSLEAELRWGKKRQPALLRLDHSKNLRSHRKERGQYVTDEQRWFEDRFVKKPGPWTMSRSAEILQTEGGEVIVPDLTFVADDGRRAYLEIIGFWRRGSLESRLEQLDDPALDGLLLAVSKRLAGEKKPELIEHPRIVWFASILSAKKVRERLDALAL